MARLLNSFSGTLGTNTQVLTHLVSDLTPKLHKTSFRTLSRHFSTPVFTGMADLTPYSGPFDQAAARHLLNRACFGVSPEMLQQSVGAGLQGTLNLLLQPDADPGAPLNVEVDNDPNVPLGQTWVNAPYSRDVNLNPSRQRSFFAWATELFYQSGLSLERKMLLFWINHFGVERMADIKGTYRYWELLRTRSLGNFKEIVELVTVDSQMLQFLNGNQSTASSPNENYARELLELFTLGKGPQIGPGDYSTYNESDVRELARALTGWRVRNQGSFEMGVEIESFYTASRHDRSDKQLSYHFNNTIISNADAEEYKEVVRIIFEHPQAGLYLSRKLYRFFVYYHIDNAVEQGIIVPMAAALRQANWDVRVPLRMLLESAHFFEDTFRGAIVKSPLEHVVDTVRKGHFNLPTDNLLHRYWLLRQFSATMDAQQMLLWAPPSVAGWKAWYQSPGYQRAWLSASTLGTRTRFLENLVNRGMTYQRVRYDLDLLALVASLDNPLDPNAVVAELAERFVPVALDTTQLDSLKEVLIPGLPDFEWTLEYGDYLANPSDNDLRRAVLGKLNALYIALLSSAESQLC